jgi:hypothetical protein
MMTMKVQIPLLAQIIIKRKDAVQAMMQKRYPMTLIKQICKRKNKFLQPMKASMNPNQK